MEKIKSTINLLKTMLNTSYDTSAFIDKETKKINKKSSRVWLLGVMVFLIIFLSYKLINELAKMGAEQIFLEIFFLISQILVIFQTIILSISVMYFSDDIQNYLYLPISNMKLFITRFAVMMSIILGTVLIIAVPSLYMYGTRVIEKNLLAYYVSVILVLFLVSTFLAALVLIIMIPIMRIFRFIKNKYWYQTVVILVVTVILVIPITNSLSRQKTVEENIQDAEVQEEIAEARQQINSVREKIMDINGLFIVGGWGVEALAKSDTNSAINVLKIFGLNALALTILIYIGKLTYIKDVLWSLSLFDKKKNKKINLEKTCKVRNKKIAFTIQELKDILKNPTFFMHYIYNAFIIISMVVTLAVIIVPIFKKIIIDNAEAIGEYSFDFVGFSIILGIMQILFTISSISLTAISRYGKNAIFFKYIPIEQRTQFRLKNIPQLIRDTIIIIIVIATIHYLFPEITAMYLVLLFVVGMLLNIINSYILLLVDLKRPQLNYENEVSVLEQNDNKIFKYVVTVSICVILWYLSKITKSLSLNTSIFVQILVFGVLILILEIIIAKNKDRLFENIK